MFYAHFVKLPFVMFILNEYQSIKSVVISYIVLPSLSLNLFKFNRSWRYGHSGLPASVFFFCILPTFHYHFASLYILFASMRCFPISFVNYLQPTYEFSALHTTYNRIFLCSFPFTSLIVLDVWYCNLSSFYLKWRMLHAINRYRYS